MQLYRRLAFGGLAEFSVLDTRQYRSDQACGDGVRTGCTDALNPTRTLPGTEQEQWLRDGLGRSQARWNVIPQQVFMAQRDFTAGPEQSFSMDAWDGYVAARSRLLGYVQNRGVKNLVVLTGDVHSHWAAELKADFNNPTSATLGVEFVGTSISSGGDGADMTPTGSTVLAENPHIRFFNGQRGYVRCVVTPAQCRADFRVLPYVSVPGAPITTRASFVVQNGVPGLAVT
jgi:alkaline phosphatase D